MKTIQLGGEFFNFDFAKSIVSSYECGEDYYYPRAIIYMKDTDKSSQRRLSNEEKLQSSEEATAKAQQIIKQALTNANL